MTGEDGLLVEKILPGGAIEAWNKQCPGEIREIRAGDSAPTQLTASCIENVMCLRFLLGKWGEVYRARNRHDQWARGKQ